MERYYSGKNEKPSLLQQIGFGNSRKYDSHLDNNAQNVKRTKKTRSSNKIDTIFERIGKELPQYIVGQNEYLRHLMLAFKRAYLVDNGKSYKNIVIILGPEGTGRNYSIKVFPELLSIEKLTTDSSLYILDFSAYADESSMDKLFYPDMYRSFYSSAPIVVFDNFDQACDEVLHSISVLGIDGILKTNKRFGWTRGEC